MNRHDDSRRQFVKVLGLAGLQAVAMPWPKFSFAMNTMIKRNIPSSGEELPVVGLGTWQTFDVGASDAERDPLRECLKLMKQHGGRVIDSSPMYGRSEKVVGDLTHELGIQDAFFYATKVWTQGRAEGIRQMEDSMSKMRRTKLDLMQIHNLVDWKTHIKTLREWKEKGKIRYLGLTHYTVSSHTQLEQIIQSEKVDFLQFNYSIAVRNAEKSLLDAARDKGVAVIINRPFEGGDLFRKTRGRDIPSWAKEIGINSWGQFFLKYILSHPAVTCVIPGTSNPRHLLDNMQAGAGALPDAATKVKMIRVVEEL